MSYSKKPLGQMSNDLANRIRDLERKNSFLHSELERVNRERIEYLQNVSHQLVAPLNAIKWHIENLTSGRVTLERAKKVLRSIYSQSTLAVHLAKNFGLMSNLDADHALTALKEPLETVNLHRLLINLADDFQPLGWDKGLGISVEDESLAKAPDVLAMRPLISQVFSNIIENAVKYSDRDSKIMIDGSHDATNHTVSVTVTNKGIPLMAEEVAKIFDRGYRTKEAKNLYPAGTGFGLYIARRIVEIHEGRIAAYPDDSGRATFEVTLSVRGLEGKARQIAAKDSSPYRR